MSGSAYSIWVIGVPRAYVSSHFRPLVIRSSWSTLMSLRPSVHSGRRPVSVERDPVLEHHPAQHQAGHALAHRPAELRGRGRRSPGRSARRAAGRRAAPRCRGCPAARRPRPTARRRRPARWPRRPARSGSGAGASASGLVSATTLVASPEVGALRGQGAAEAAGEPGLLGGQREQDLRRARAAGLVDVAGQEGHERVVRQVGVGVVTVGDEGDGAGVVRGVARAGLQQRSGVEVPGHGGGQDQDEEHRCDAANEAHGRTVPSVAGNRAAFAPVAAPTSRFSPGRAG